MRNSPLGLVFLVLMVLLDLYVFQALKLVSQSASPKTRLIIFAVYWTLSIAALLVLVLLPYLQFEQYPKGFRNVLFAVIIGLFFGKLVISLFMFADDLRRGIQWAATRLFNSKPVAESLEEGDRISRSTFMTWLGVAAGSTLFGSLAYGFSNKYNYQVKKLSLHFPNLPQAFKGMKVVQISDVHSGSFTDKAAVHRGIDKILEHKPDLILFTGDLVNNKAEEMHEYKEVFSRLQAKHGVYSVLGNHDYGDYVEWGSKEEKHANLESLKQVHGDMGWKLLLNEHAVIDREGEQIALLGVENWSSKARFPKYGRLHEAHAGTENFPFKILMSHDPSHWEGEVLEKYNDIDLMLAGHTHGMQFGVEIPWLKWSPVQYVYKQWAGLYQNGTQRLYVNRGFGFVGYPGRVGILPEITLIELV